MERRTFLVGSASALAGTKFADTVESQAYQARELEGAIAERIGDERHRWVDIVFKHRGDWEPHYQITNIHHNLTRLDDDMLPVVNAIAQEWNLELQEDRQTPARLRYQTLTYSSESAREHRILAEAFLTRVYNIELAQIDEVSQSHTE